jgi:hypothetical protein
MVMIITTTIIIKSRGVRRAGQGMWHEWKRREKCTRFWWESWKERDHSEDRGVDGIG